MKIQILFLIIAAFIIACGSGEEKPKVANADITPTEKPDPNKAIKKIYASYCVACHGKDGKMGINGAKDFAESTLSVEERIEVISNGAGLMTPFKNMLKEDQIKALAEYTVVLGSAK